MAGKGPLPWGLVNFAVTIHWSLRLKTTISAAAAYVVVPITNNNERAIPLTMVTYVLKGKLCFLGSFCK